MADPTFPVIQKLNKKLNKSSKLDVTDKRELVML